MATANGGTADRPAVGVLAVAAEEREFSGLLRRIEDKRRLAGWPLACVWSAEVAGIGWLLVADGPGPMLAGNAARVALERVLPGGVLSTGLCGALDGGLAPGNVVIASEVLDGQGHTWSGKIPGRNSAGPDRRPVVKLLSIDRVANTAAEKLDLAVKTGAAIIEMEAAGVAASAAEQGLPFFCVRAVSDTASEDLPLDFNRFRDLQGRFSRGRIAAACMLRPWLAPGLIRFDSQCRRAADRLGDCLVDCRFA